MNQLDEAIDKLVHDIVEKANPLRIILFGSAARGDTGVHSDIDLLVVVPEAQAETALAALRDVPVSSQAQRIGQVEVDPAGQVVLVNALGAKRHLPTKDHPLRQADPDAPVLFDLETDVAELVDVSAQHPDALAQARARYEAACATLPPPPGE